MKIDDSNKNPALTGVATSKARAGKAVEKADGAGTDSVKISPQSQALAKQATSSGAVFDAAKVQEIKAAIADGSFKVNPERVADGLMDSVRELISSNRNKG